MRQSCCLTIHALHVQFIIIIISIKELM
jgi:hypothetical protein